jgi:hypothetical protein
MDCIIPGHSVRPFCAAIACLSRVGKDLLWEFDPVDGLTIRALSDSKAVFSSFHYEPTFFHRCSNPPLARKRKRKKQRDNGRNNDDDDDEGDEDAALGRWCVRVAIKSLAGIVRPRKDVLSLQLLTVGDLLAFEFQLQRPEGVVTRVTHKVGVAAAQSIAAVASMDKASELVVQPSVVLTMLEPLRRSAEMALLINDTHKLISSVSFTHADLGESNGESNALAAAKAASSLRTETSIGFDELVDLHYVSLIDEDEQEEAIPPPRDLKEQVVLVFTIKEFKAMLQFCAQSHVDQELPITLQFFWGGKPMVATTKAQGFSAELVMATLDHKLLGSMKASAGSTD